MRQLLNTLYLNADGYLHLENENIVVKKGKEVIVKVPLLNLEAICCFGHMTVSNHLMGVLGKRGISLCFFSPFGRFQARSVGMVTGNILLRSGQFELMNDDKRKLEAARSIIFAKVYNAKGVIDRYGRDHPYSLDLQKLKAVSGKLKEYGKQICTCEDLDTLRGLEGKSAVEYFSIMDELILIQKESFHFGKRSRRPPIGMVNALLSFTYSLLTNDIVSACESVGLDPYIGINHVLRPGRPALALDLIEEFRSVICDRFVLSLINRKMIVPEDFHIEENQACHLTDEGRKKFLNAWQKKKQEEIIHPYLKEKIPWGLITYVQAKLMASFIRGDIDSYPSFMWK